MSNTVPPRPNVVVFFTDQQRWDSCGLNGNPLDLTPNFDRYARAGTHIPHCFTCQPVCGPARACLQTGLYATANGCWTNGIPLNPKLGTLAHCFNDAGYQTAYVGKWHLGAQRPRTASQAVAPEDRGGYQYWLAANLLEHCSDAYDCVVYDHDNSEVRLPGYRVDALTDAAIRFIDGRRKDSPFFLFLSQLEPHHQNHRDDYPAPAGYDERYRGRWTPPDLAALGGSAPVHLAGYWGMVRRLDEAFGRLMDALRSLRLLDDTIVCFVSDHGCHFKTRNEEYKRSCHESSIRVPALLYGRGFMAGGDCPELVSLIDLPPTLLDAAGLPVPSEMQGRSLLSRQRNPGTYWPEEIFVQVSGSEVGRAVRTKRWKYGVRAADVQGNDAPHADTYHEAYLYDLASDPYELVNLIEMDSHHEVRRSMRERLVRRMVDAGERPPEGIIEPKQASPGQRRVLAGECDE